MVCTHRAQYRCEQSLMEYPINVIWWLYINIFFYSWIVNIISIIILPVRPGWDSRKRVLLWCNGVVTPECLLCAPPQNAFNVYHCSVVATECLLYSISSAATIECFLCRPIVCCHNWMFFYVHYCSVFVPEYLLYTPFIRWSQNAFNGHH